MDAAVADGVDVLSLSLGGPSLPFDEDTIAVGAFGAIEDRNIRVTVMLGNGLSFDGESIFQPNSFPPALYPLVYAGANGNPATALCANGSFDGFDVKGKIVLCDRGGGIARLEKGAAVLSAGGIGMILANQATDGYSTLADAHVLPASHVGFAAGDQIKAYINSSSNPTSAFLFKGTILGTSPAPAITSFSSRGPSLASPGILKPDITGPGVSVLAAWPFRVGIISGTSMSTPHLSGIAALIKSARPDWSPAAIKSAIMTTASVVDHSGKPIVNEQLLPADLFAIGAGHVNPVKASNPGLVYDLSADDYIAYLCGLGYASKQVSVIARRTIDCSAVSSIPEKDLNYPSISVTLGGNTTYAMVERRVKNVGNAGSTYWAEVGAPYGTYARVHPPVLRFNYVNQEKRFFVVFKMVGGGGGSQGYLKWVSVNHEVRSPISITYKH
ncbi:subtilisin-like protease [Musa troglodytarum]|uniref:Subtilisin-like protease n=1 Tax=Musa troglodytarum TaxID=320322 RepID=A0A9E7EPE5_9LILI|nr:subtilisin-like protease [Musa troglodytarum]URD81711.1 subtilisin-like protease [Musa troglodytarum]